MPSKKSMKRKIYGSYFLLALFFFTIFYLPNNWVQRLRLTTISLVSVCWKKPNKNFSPKQELELENILLKKQNASLHTYLLSEQRINDRLQKLKSFQSVNKKRDETFFNRRRNAIEKLLTMELFSITSQVIYRDPTHWNSTLWINSGEKENETLGEKIIAINSPVLKGSYLIGIVEYVGKSKSRIRLLTDASLVPSVRVVREGGDRELLELIERVQERLALRNDLKETFTTLNQTKKYLTKDFDERYLAKGELFGSSFPIWRSCSHILKGIGFNYDFADEEGPALELCSGKPLDHLTQHELLAIIKQGDLLVTTGMDGIFPADLPVAIISSVAPLKEGEVAFNIEAKLCAGNLNHLKEVVILPPVSMFTTE